MTVANNYKRRVLRDDVVEHIIASIIDGTLEPGDRIVETQISRELRVSQGAVREAIRDLIARGFVETEPYKGSKVKAVSRKEMQEYFAVRCELESLAVAWGLKHDSVEVETLRSIVAEMKSAAYEGDLGKLLKADIDFHRKIIEFSKNSALMRSWEALANDYWIYTQAKKELSGDRDFLELSGRHVSILEAIESGNVSLIRKRLEEHIAV